MKRRHLNCIFSSNTCLRYLPTFWRKLAPNLLNTAPRLSWQRMAITTNLAWLTRCNQNFQTQHTCFYLVLKMGIDISRLVGYRQVLAGIDRIFCDGIRAESLRQAICLILISISNLEVFGFVASIHNLDHLDPHFGSDLPLANLFELTIIQDHLVVWLPITTLRFNHLAGCLSNHFFRLLLNLVRLYPLHFRFAFYSYVP